MRVGLILAALTLGAFMSLGCASMAPAQSQERLVKFEAGQPTEIRVAQGKFVNARTSGNVSRLVVGDPNVATAVPLTNTTFYVLGKAEGRTNVSVYGANDTLLGLIDVEVGADVPDLKETLQAAIPQSKIRVETINGRVRLSGSVPDGIAQRKALEIAEQYSSSPVINALNVTGGQQVLLEVRVVEASRSAGRQLGVSWFGRGKGSTVSSGAAASQRGLNVGGLLPNGQAPFGTLVAQIIGGGISADILVQALEEKGLGRRLAEPNLTALIR